MIQHLTQTSLIAKAQANRSVIVEVVTGCIKMRVLDLQGCFKCTDAALTAIAAHCLDMERLTADGLLIVAEAGTFRAAGRTLAAVRAEARAALARRYTNLPTDVALAVPRRFSVYVSGAVPQPGRQVVTALGRVEDAIAETTDRGSPLDLADYATPARFEVERRVAVHRLGARARFSMVSCMS